MRKIKRFTVGFLMVVTACLMAVGLSGCTQKGDREKQEVHVCEWEVEMDIAATCTSDAKVKMVCKDSTCGKTQTVTLSGTKLDHKYEDEALLTVAPTCTEDGYVKKHSCVLCGGATIQETKTNKKATGHDLDFSNSKSRAANCQEQAYCGDCGMFYGDKLMHEPDLVVYKALAPTCTLPGHTEYVECRHVDDNGVECNYTTYKVLYSLGHDGEKGVKKTDANGDEYLYYDNILNSSDKIGGVYVFANQASHAATCYEAAYCGICKQSYGEFGHDAKASGSKAATCLEPAHCGVCDQDYGESLGGHTYEVCEAKAQTCEEQGWGKYFYCTRCKYSTQEILPALGHNWSVIKAVEPTCTEVGWTEGEQCLRCRVIRIEPAIVAALGHDGMRDGQEELIKSNSIIPDCTRKGYCGICKTTYGETSATGQHTVDVIAAKAPTCSEIGWYEYAKCRYCSYSTYEQNIREPLDHNYVKYEYQAPTCTTEGVAAQTICTNCQKLEKIPALGHDVDCTRSADSVKGNCLKKGYCGVCKQEYGKPSGAHEVGTPATCTEKAICRVCQEEYGKPIGHIVRPDGNCANCGEYIGMKQQAIVKKNKEDAE